MGSRRRQSNPRPTHNELVRRPLRLSVSYNPDACCTWHGGSMTSESRHISEWIDRRADEVYGYASDPANLPQWAPGLGTSVEKVDERWLVETSEGRVGFAFVQRNEHGVLDHYVTLPSGEVVYNPMRVIADGSSCEVVFTLRRRPGMSDEDFMADAEAVAADLTRLKRVLEGR
jgi:Polyketide cyclase / dehydrase and lipid transport